MGVRRKMIYPFRCDNCNQDVEITAPMKDGPPKDLVCTLCGKPLRRVWAASVVIPDHMKAGDDMHTAICNRMKHGTRPSGRSKVLW